MYVLRGHVLCKEAQRILKDWFLDRHHTQRYGRWLCFDSHGAALFRGQIEYCTTRSGAKIADYAHRLHARMAARKWCRSASNC